MTQLVGCGVVRCVGSSLDLDLLPDIFDKWKRYKCMVGTRLGRETRPSMEHDLFAS